MSDTPSSLQAARHELQAKWQAMAPRERQLLSIMAALMVLVLLVMVGVRPALRTLQQTPTQLREINATLDDMRRLADEVRTLRQMPPVPPAQAQAIFTSATQRLGAGAQVRMDADRIMVTLQRVPGARLAEWLAEVRSGARVRPLDGNVVQAEPGFYTGTLTLAWGSAPAPAR